MQEFKISRQELLELLFDTGTPDITTSDLAVWLQTKTDNQFTVIHSNHIKDVLIYHQHLNKLVERLREEQRILISKL